MPECWTLENETIPRAEETVTMPVIFVIDTSERMGDFQIARLNKAMRELIDEWRVKAKQEGLDIRINVLSYSTGCKWMFDTMQNVDTLQWQNLQADGLSAALDSLNRKLERHSLYGNLHRGGRKRPLIVFIAAGIPTDDWEDALKALLKNYLFIRCARVAVAVDDIWDNKWDMEYLGKLTGTKETVLQLSKHGWPTIVSMINRVIDTTAQVDELEETEREIEQKLWEEMEMTRQNLSRVDAASWYQTDKDIFSSWE